MILKVFSSLTESVALWLMLLVYTRWTPNITRLQQQNCVLSYAQFLTSCYGNPGGINRIEIVVSI